MKKKPKKKGKREVEKFVVWEEDNQGLHYNTIF